jgi:hypothetical protein
VCTLNAKKRNVRERDRGGVGGGLRERGSEGERERDSSEHLSRGGVKKKTIFKCFFCFFAKCFFLIRFFERKLKISNRHMYKRERERQRDRNISKRERVLLQQKENKKHFLHFFDSTHLRITKNNVLHFFHSTFEAGTATPSLIRDAPRP